MNQGFKHYIKANNYSQTYIKEISKTLKNDCKEWIIEAANKLVYRGVFSISNDPYIMRKGPGLFYAKVRTDRKPKDSPLWLHNCLNEHFQHKVKASLRSESVFCSGDKSQVEIYGKPFCVFPIGVFSYAWSKYIADASHTFYIGPMLEETLPEAGLNLNTKINEAFKRFANDILHQEIDSIDSYLDYLNKNRMSLNAQSPTSDWSKFVRDFISNHDLWQFNKGLNEALGPQFKMHEIMVKCQDYYLVDIELAENINCLSNNK